MTGISKLEDVTTSLHQALEKIGTFEECALLDYPAYPNIGDNLIWLGTIFYLTDVLKTKIKYASSISDFSETLLERKIGKSPILLQGGGNFGDLWPRFQLFREQIISKYRDRQIVIMPQSIYFSNIDNLKKSAEIFNSHPNLTLFIRDNYSYEIATQYFQNCQVIKAPDMAFQMVNMPGLSLKSRPDSSTLYLYRQDRETDWAFSPTSLAIPDLVVEDWVSYTWMSKIPKDWIYIPGLVRLVREGWQRGLGTPREWMSRQVWENVHPYAFKFNTLDNPSIHRRSWSLMHSGIYQLKGHRLIITNRLHVHILCLLLGIPHIVLPGSYYKIELFYETWTHQLPLCKLVKDPSQVKVAAQELLASLSS
jgi:pyruvyl transferase EpsO